jgi:hypothetical protein
MLTLAKSTVFVRRHIRDLRGGTQAILAEASDGHVYVVKFNCCVQGANLPFNESAGTELYRALNLPSPAWNPLLVTDSFLDENPGCRVQSCGDSVRPVAGLCFGSRYLGESGERLLEILPGGSFKRVNNHSAFWLAWLVDICAGHVDNRQAIFTEDQAGWLNAVFLDHGHMFGGPQGDEQRHFLASRYLDPRVYQEIPLQPLEGFRKTVQCLDVDKLWNDIQALPEDWKTASALAAMTQCLNRLSDPSLLRNIMDTMVDAQYQVQQRERRAQHDQLRKAASSVRRAAVQSMSLRHAMIGRDLACA